MTDQQDRRNNPRTEDTDSAGRSSGPPSWGCHGSGNHSYPVGGSGDKGGSNFFSNSLLGYAFIFLLALLAVGALFFDFSLSPRPGQEEEIVGSGNLVNRGLAAGDGEWLYYTSLEDQEESGIFKVRPNEEDLSKIVKDGADYLNVEGEWIYYRNRDEGDRIYRIKTDGSSRERLSEYPVGKMWVQDERIYFQHEEDKTLYGADLEVADVEQLTEEELSGFMLDDDWIYFYRQGSEETSEIYRLRPDGTQPTLLKELPGIDSLNVYQDHLYFCRAEGESGIYRMDKEGSGLEQLVETPSSYINVAGGSIFYSNQDDGETLYRYDVGEEESNGEAVGRPLRLNDDPTHSIQVVGEWIFYSHPAYSSLFQIRWDGNWRKVVQ